MPIMPLPVARVFHVYSYAAGHAGATGSGGRTGVQVHHLDLRNTSNLSGHSESVITCGATGVTRLGPPGRRHPASDAEVQAMYSSLLSYPNPPK